MIATISPRELPAAAGNKLYLDYIAGTGTAGQFLAHGPTDFGGALGDRKAHHYPRDQVVSLLTMYNAGLGASGRTLDNIAALADPQTYCVISGQQVGFLGGPAYTAYKIVTTIRLATYLEKALHGRFVPVFWLASEDHDLGEINHTYLIQRDGEVGKVSFGWEQEGLPISALPISGEILRAFEDYWSGLLPGSQMSAVREMFSPRTGEDFTAWHARIWLDLFDAQGLVLVEPRTLRPLAGAFLRSCLRHGTEIQRRLGDIAQQLVHAGYEPQLTSEYAGQLYTFDQGGSRVRVDDAPEHADEVVQHPERYSTDAALRPLFADWLLPIVASVLGPGETAYHAMLKPLYELFELPQPLLFPRKSYTVVGRQEAERLVAYQIGVQDILAERMDSDDVFRDLLPVRDVELFAAAQRGLTGALAPLKPYLEDIDPSLGTTWSQTLANADRGLERLRERAFRARLGQLGFSKGELRRLQNVLLPRARLQERVLPLPHFLNRHGLGFLDRLMSAGELLSFDHQVLTVGDEHA